MAGSDDTAECQHLQRGSFLFFVRSAQLYVLIGEERMFIVSSICVEVMRKFSYIQSIRPRSSSSPRGRWHLEQRAKRPPACGCMFPRSTS